MLTIFSIPKPFRGHDGIIQRNAILSWKNLEAECQIILIGDDEGVADIAEELDILHIPDVELTNFGTPYLDDAFSKAQDHAQYDILCYLNADIIIFDDLIAASEVIKKEHADFLIVGQRTDLDVRELIEFNATWKTDLQSSARSSGRLHSPTGMDYFIFPRNSIRNLPHFAVGRPAWDGWMVYNALRSNKKLVNATESILCIHQNHDYGHVPASRNRTWNGPEGDENLRIVYAIPGYWPLYYNIARSKWVLKNSQLDRDRNIRNTAWRLKAYLFTHSIFGSSLRNIFGIIARFLALFSGKHSK